MHTITKFLIASLVPLLFFVLAPASQAAVIPPSEECLTKMDQALEKFRDAPGDDQERAIWQEVVDAGCLDKNPFDGDKGTEKCSAEITAANQYLAPINKAMAPVAQRIDRLDRFYIKRSNVLDRKIKKAEKAGNKKRVKQLEREFKQLNNRYERTMIKIARQNKVKVDLYDAPVWLVYGHLISKDCNLDGWTTTNRNALVVVILDFYRSL